VYQFDFESCFKKSHLHFLDGFACLATVYLWACYLKITK